jgi:hypothetical protein
MIGHWPDRFNHTSLDTLDKVDPQELQRAAVIGGACAWTLANADGASHAELATIIVHHTLRRLLRGSTSQWGADFLDHIAQCGTMQIDALEGMTGVRDQRGRKAIQDQKRLLCKLHALRPSASDGQTGPIVKRNWPGPLNVRGLLQEASGAPADRLRHRIAASKSIYAAILSLALAIDDRSSRTDVVRRAAYSSMMELDRQLADDVFEALLSASWIREI